jgi:sodium-dependent dicarboxylate transporter 2/3/5
MDPAVWFVFASLSVGVAFTKTGLTKRMAYRALGLVGERTSMVYLACFLVTAALTLLMAHTAVAAAVFPLLLLIHGRYTSDTGPTRFGKGLFIGMAFACGAGSIITLLGSPRTVLAIGFFARIDGEAVDFLELSWYLAPVGALMVVVIWLFVLLRYPPEKPTLPGLADEARRLYRGLGPWSRDQALVLAVVALAVGALAARPWVPALTGVDSAAILLLATLAFFVLGVLDLSDLESLSWNIVLLFGGAMSIGLCLWQTGATAWMADHWLGLVGGAHWAVIVLSLAGLVLVVANFVMNAAAIAIALPFALVCAHQLGLHGRPVLFACLAAAGMPFLLLVGAAPNAIAYASKQFTPREFWLAGLPVSLLLLVVLALFVLVVWPLMGMPIHR